jgi:hypothetical protein
MPEQTGTQGGTPQGGAPATTQTPTQGGGGSTLATYDNRRDAVQGIADRLITRHGTSDRAIEVLAGENFDYRETIRQRDAEIATLRQRQVPDGGVVLTGADAQRWEKFNKLAITDPDKVAERLTRADTLESEQQKNAARTLYTDAAKPFGWNGDVLADLIPSKGLAVEMRDVAIVENGKSETKKLPFVRTASDTNAAWQRLDEYATAHLPAYLPALTAVPQGGTQQPGTQSTQQPGTQPTTQGVINWPGATTTQGTQQGGSIVDQHLAKRNAAAASRPNPLVKNQPASTTK